MSSKPKSALSKKGPYYAHGKSRGDAWKLPLSKISTRPPEEDGTTYNPRDFLHGIEALAASIAANGLRKPISLTYDKEADLFYPTDGHRRYAALCMLQADPPEECKVDFEAIPVERDLAKPGSLEHDLRPLTDNDQHPLTPLEKGRQFARLRDVHGLTAKEISTHVTESNVIVGRYLLLADCPEDLCKIIREGHISGTLAAHLLAKHREDPDRAVAEVKSAVRDLPKGDSLRRADLPSLRTSQKPPKEEKATDGDETPAAGSGNEEPSTDGSDGSEDEDDVRAAATLAEAIEKAVAWMRETDPKKITTSAIQREFKIGYNTATLIIDHLLEVEMITGEKSPWLTTGKHRRPDTTKPPELDTTGNTLGGGSGASLLGGARGSKDMGVEKQLKRLEEALEELDGQATISARLSTAEFLVDFLRGAHDKRALKKHLQPQ